MAAAVLIFGLLLTLLALLLTRAHLFSGEEATRLIALVPIVTGTLFLVTAGYSAEQIAPALGLLGTVAGYLLRRAEEPRPDADRGRDKTNAGS
jgi:Trk-type K+ transport system membrane component